MARKNRHSRRQSAPRCTVLRRAAEVFEERCLLATLMVVNTNDSGAGSFRDAIVAANNADGQDRIEFNLAYGIAGHKYYLDDGVAGKVAIANIREVGPTGAATDSALPNFDPDWKNSWWSIAAPTGLPTITGRATIDGYSQPGASENSQHVGSNAVHRIEVDFADWTSTAFGLAGTDNTVKGLVINRAQNNGIHVISGGGNTIVGNYIGTDISGTLARGVSVGVRLGIQTATTSNWIGGPDLADRNVIVAAVTFGPQRAAVYIHNSHTTAATPLNNIIQGNYIGTNAAGSAALQGGSGSGIQLSDASNNTISGNVISGTSNGILFGGFTANNNNVIQGNLIGLDAGGSFPIPNSVGIAESGYGTVIGGTTEAERNVISGNRVQGILVYGGSAALPIRVLGNYIGTDATGSYAVPNSIGISPVGLNILIGGPEPGAGNVISGNTSYGIGKGHGFGDGSSRTIQGNLIGTNATGTCAIPNAIGIFLAGTSTTVNLIGGVNEAERNIISGNGTGIYLADSSAVVQGNYIGADITGARPLGNGNGVYVAGEFAPGLERALIGGTMPGSGNVIAYNRNTGVEVDIRAQDRATILGNSIHDNGALGIELPHQVNIYFVTGPTPNDVGDVDDGFRAPNALQNYPVIASASSGGGITTVAGSLNSLAGQSFRIEFFSNAVIDPSGYGEGERYLGFTNVTTDAGGNVSFTATLPVATPAGHFVTATATRLREDPIFVASWSGDGNTNDLVGGHNGTLVNGATYAPGNIGQAFSLDGVNDYVSLPRISRLAGLTFEAWVNTTSTDAISTYAGNAALNLLGDSTGSVWLGFGVHGGKVRYNHYASAWQNVTGTTAINDGNWHHIAVTHDQWSGEVSLYVDGLVNATGNIPYNTTYPGVDRIGAGYANHDPFKGLADEIGIFKRALSAAEIQAIHSQGDPARPRVAIVPWETSEFSLNRVVVSSNSPPVANPDAYTVNEDATLTVAAPGVLGNDTDTDGNMLTASLKGTSNGTVTLNPNGSFSFTPAADFNGIATFEYYARDAAEQSNLGLVTITVTAVNDPPSFIKGADKTVAEDAGPQTVSSWATNISAGRANESGQMLQFQVSNSNNALFAVQPTISADGTLTYTPAMDANGTATITVTLMDNGGTANGGQDTSGVQSFTIMITPVNDAPIANDDFAITNEDTAVTISVLANDRPGPLTATDEANQTLTVTRLNGVSVTVGQVLATANGTGTVRLNADGTVTYAPNANYHGSDGFSYTATDNGAPPMSTSASGFVTINPVNDAPILETISPAFPAINEDDVSNVGSSLPALIAVLSITDVDAGAVQGIAVTGVDNSNGTWQFSTDGGSSWAAFGSASNTAARLLAESGSNRLRFVPAANYFGPATFTFRAWDQTSGTSGSVADTSQNGGITAFSSTAGTAVITVNPVNDAPMAAGNSYSTDEDTPLVVAAPGLLANDTDVDNAILRAIKFSDPSHGALTLNADGSFSYVPAINYFGPDSFSYKTNDGSLDSNVVTVSITINSVNDAPVANAGLDQGAFEGETVQFSGNGSADVEGDALTYSWSFGDGGTATGPTPSHAYTDNGSYRVTLTVSDGSASRTDTLTVLATNVNPAATLANSGPVSEGSPVIVSFLNPFDPSSADTAAGFTYSYDFNNDGDFIDAGEAADVTAVSQSFTFADNGIHTVHGRIKDKDGGYTDYYTDVVVNNVAPTAANDTAITDEDLTVRINVLGNDSDPADALDPLEMTSVSGGSKGTTAIDTRGTPDPADDEIVYTPNAGATGSDSFTYAISDGDGGTATGTVTVQIRNLVDVSGRVFDDKDNDGFFEPGDGEIGIGGVNVQLFDQTSGLVLAMQMTATDGTYSFDVNLAAGTYKVVAAQPAGFLDGRETAGNLGGAVDNSQESNQIADITVGTAGTMVDAVDYLFAEIGRSQALGLVWEDFNDDGEVNPGEKAIQGVAVELTGIDDRGQAVSRSATTDANGIYSFADLRPSSGAGYALRELQPAGFVDGRDSLGTVNGVSVGDSSVNDTFHGVVLSRPGSMAENYNFGERPPAEGQVVRGQTATIGFWQNKNGQSLIKALNGGPTSTQLGNWLATTLPNLYGGLGGKTNAQLAEFYKTLFVRTAQTAAGGGPPKVDAQVLAVSLATYVTNQTLAGTTATGYGFLVTENGVGTRTFNVGSGGAAFGVANNSNVSVLDLLLALNSRSRNGLLFDLDGDGDANDGQETLFRTMANDVFSAINEAGDI